MEPVTEAELKAKAVAPRITPEHIEGIIEGEYYISADKLPNVLAEHIGNLMCLTLCVLVLKNGFTVVGQSACASPDNYNYDIGKRLARQDAFNKIWQLEGYLLRSQLAVKQEQQD